MKKILLLISSMLIGMGLDAQNINFLNPREEVLPTLLSARATGHIEKKDNVQKPLTLLHFSDLHGNNDNLARIIEFRGAYSAYIDDAIHTGDAVTSYWDDPNPLEVVYGAKDILNVVGNHDCWKGHLVWAQSDTPYDAPLEDAYNKILRPSISQWNVTQPHGVTQKGSMYYCACYYYKDYPESGIRLIVLDGLHYTKIQSNWFEEALAQAANLGYSVVAANHFPPQCGMATIPEPTGFNSSNTWELSRVISKEGKQMERIPTSAFDSVEKFINNGGSFICWIGGHTHADFIGYVNDHEDQIMIIVEKAGAFDRYMYEDRSVGTRNQDAFNLLTINPQKKMFTIQRIGSNRNDLMQSKKLFVYDYKNRKVVVSE